MASALAELAEVCAVAGRGVRLVQAGGGNASIKSADGRRMWIKASGLRLADVHEDAGHVALDLVGLRASLQALAQAALPPADAALAAGRDLLAAVQGPGALRPSLEAGFHAVLGRVVLHTHPIALNAFACLADGAEQLARCLGRPIPSVPACLPGWPLCAAVQAARVGLLPDGAEELLLGNHGWVVAGPDAALVLARTTVAAARAEAWFGGLDALDLASREPPVAAERWASAARNAVGTSGVSPAIVRAARLGALAQSASAAGLDGRPLVPDDVVYGVHRLEVVDTAPEAWARGARAPFPARPIAVSGAGVVLAGPSAASVDALEEVLLANLLIRRLAARRGRVIPLPALLVAGLEGLESERHRRGVLEG